MCDVEFELEDGTTIEFELECSDVRIDLEPKNGKFVPRDNALCEIQVVDPDGLVRIEKVRCVEVPERQGTTTTTTEEPTTTTIDGDGSPTTSDPGSTDPPPATDPTTTTTTTTPTTATTTTTSVPATTTTTAAP